MSHREDAACGAQEADRAAGLEGGPGTYHVAMAYRPQSLLTFWRQVRRLTRAAARRHLELRSIRWGAHLNEARLNASLIGIARIWPSHSVTVLDSIFPCLSRDHLIPPTDVVLVQNAHLDPNLGSVGIDRYILAESISIELGELKVTRPLGFGLRRSRLTTEQPVFTLGRSTYYHFLLEDLAGLVNVCYAGIEPQVYLSPRQLPQARQALDSLGLLYTVGNRPTQAKLAVFATRSQSGIVHPKHIEAIRHAFLGDGGDKGHSRIYVSRRGSQRSPIGEERLELYLSHHGFQIVRLEDLDWQTQIDLFSNATHVVGPHGAGLANLCFASAGTRVVELAGPTYANPCFSQISNHLSLSHETIVLDYDPATLGGTMLGNWDLHVRRIERALER